MSGKEGSEVDRDASLLERPHLERRLAGMHREEEEVELEEEDEEQAAMDVMDPELPLIEISMHRRPLSHPMSLSMQLTLIPKRRRRRLSWKTW